MLKGPTFTWRDFPAILRLAKKKYREGNNNYLDNADINTLKKNGLPLTRRNAALYNFGGAVGAVCIILPVMLFYSCSPQEFVRQSCFWRLLESIGPILIPGLLWVAAKHTLPAFALNVRANFLIGLIGYTLLCLIYNFATFGQG